MKCGARVALGVAGGYVLGRTKKMKLALMLAGMAAGRQAGGPGQILAQGSKLLSASPELGALAEQVRGRLLAAAKGAVLVAATRQVEALTDRVGQRVESLGDLGAGRKSRDKAGPADEDTQPEGDIAPEGAADEDEPEVVDDAAEDDADEDSAEVDSADEDSAAEYMAEEDEEPEEEPPPPRRTPRETTAPSEGRTTSRTRPTAGDQPPEPTGRPRRQAGSPPPGTRRGRPARPRRSDSDD